MKWLCNIWLGLRGFFEGQDGSLSMSRLMTFLAYWPAAYIAIMTHSVEMASAILTVYVVQYGASRAFDVKQTKADNTTVQSTTIASTITEPKLDGTITPTS